MSTPNENGRRDEPSRDYRVDDVPHNVDLSETPNRPEAPNDQDNKNSDAVSLHTLSPDLNHFLDPSNETYEMYPGVEGVQYDFAGERINSNGTTIFESIVHLLKNCLGAGVLSIHEGFKIGGLWTSLVGILVLGALEIYIMFILIKSAHRMYQRVRVPRLGYPDLAEAALATGPWKWARPFSKCFRYIVDLCIVTNLCATCCIYEIMIARTLKQVLEGVSTDISDMDLSLRVYIMIIMPVVVMLCIVRNLKFLVPFSLIADIFVGMAVLATVYYSVSAARNVAITDRPGWKDVFGLMHFSGVCLYSIDGVTFILPIENHLKNPLGYAAVIFYAMPTAVATVAIAGFSGYYGWGEECKSPLTLHLPLDVPSIIIQHLLVATLTVTFSLSFWVAFRTIWHYMGKPYINSKRRVIWERIHRVVLVFLVTSMSLALPKLIEMITIVGSMILSLLVFIFPPFIETLVTWCENKKYRRYKLMKNLALMSLGAVIWSGGVYYAVHVY